MTTTRVFTNPKTPYKKLDGVTVNSAGKLYFREPGVGSTTLKNIYANKELTVPLLNPLTLDDGGRTPEIYLNGDYNVELKDSDDVQVWRIDHYQNIIVEGQFDEWDASLTYAANDYVQHSNGKYYLSLQSGNVGNTPNTSLTWWLQAFVSQFDEWDAEIQYGLNDYVRTGSNYFVSLSTSNLNKATTDRTYWSEAFFITVYNSLKTYIEGDFVYYDGNLYTSLQASNTGNTPDASTAFWKRPGTSVPPVSGFSGQIIKYIADSTLAAFTVIGALPSGLTSTVGATGSGATFTWAALDVVPANATSVTIGVTATAQKNTGASAIYQVDCTLSGDGLSNQIVATTLADYGSTTEPSITKSAGVFDVAIQQGNVVLNVFLNDLNTDSSTLFLTLEGFSVAEL